MTTLPETETSKSDLLRLPCTRASVFDPLESVDPWISRCRCCSDLLALYLHNRPIAVFPGSPLDIASLNHLLFRLRQRPMKQCSLYIFHS